MSFQYIPFHPLTRAQLHAPLLMSDVSWSEVVQGSGTFTGKIARPTDPDARELLRAATIPDSSAIYVRDPETASWVWGGVINSRRWDPETGTIKIDAIQWRTWLYRVFLGPKTDLSADSIYSWTSTDQLDIARGIVSYATAAGVADGRPSILLGSETSGRLRDLTVRGSEFRYAGDSLDSIANRAGGFEWDLIPVSASDGLPQPKLALYYPERGGILSGIAFEHTPRGGNCRLAPGQVIEESTVDRRTRVWTTGSPESLPFAQDSDPDLPTGFILLKESVDSFSEVTIRTTLASYARAERAALNPQTHFITILCSETNPPITSYGIGDRPRFIYQDGWYDIDLDQVRIAGRTVRPREGGGDVEIVLDISDTEAAQVDAGGAV